MTSTHPFAVRLGRHVNHDPRSWEYQAKVAATWRPVNHRHYGPVLDQGQLGSCTGNAMAQALNTAGLHRTGHLFTELDAISFYSAATRLDGAPGSYPPEDTGSDGLSVCKGAQQAGTISAYHHAFSYEQAIGALQLGPVLFGTNWHEAMFTPDKDGTVHPDGNIAGGHEICALGDDGKRIRLINSWGKGWGKAGYFYLSHDDFKALLADQGDITVPVR